MNTILMMIAAVGLIAGSLAAATMLCWVLWQIFRQIRHPGWAAWIIVIFAVLAITGKLPNSEFLDMVLAFAIAAAVPLWMEGREWRRDHEQPVDRAGESTLSG